VLTVRDTERIKFGSGLVTSAGDGGRIYSRLPAHQGTPSTVRCSTAGKVTVGRSGVVPGSTWWIGGVGGWLGDGGGRRHGLPAQQETLSGVRAVRVEDDSQSIGAGDDRIRQRRTAEPSQFQRRTHVLQLTHRHTHRPTNTHQ